MSLVRNWNWIYSGIQGISYQCTLESKALAFFEIIKKCMLLILQLQELLLKWSSSHTVAKHRGVSLSVTFTMRDGQTNHIVAIIEYIYFFWSQSM